ncbi:MAG: transcriptional regulator [Candidatus Muiribacterium halophilum]|uniref:Transcriptional regulator n=1 Tax=Muiribacterium halophilum TaxID=2053465 RepID=A0A2N5ZKR8_MUIH1|nr:MAG: transcriptional regulator [Candidatus Muirbacterium halophilum]
MKISTRARYGMRALIEIAMSNGHPISIKQISKNTNISSRYLEQILRELKKNELLDTIQGIKGGFILKKDPEKLTVKEVVDILEGEDYPVACVVNDSLCENTSMCATGEMWMKVREAMIDVFKNHTIADLMLRQTKLETRD